MSDYVAMLTTTVGPGVRALADEFKVAGDYLRHALQMLALESAEAAAERLHREDPRVVGLSRCARLDEARLFQAAIGACGIVRLSRRVPSSPTRRSSSACSTDSIGVQLTEGFMMDPEASVSALVVHHPQARYFTA